MTHAILLQGLLLSTLSGELIIPQVAQGGGISSQIVLSNPSSQTDSGRVEFYDAQGQPLSLNIGGSLQDSADFSIAPGGIFRIQASSSGPIRTGYVAIRSQQEESRLTAGIIYQFNGTEVSTLAAAPSMQYHVVVERGPSAASAVAMLNPSNRPVEIQLRLLDEEGLEAVAETVALEPGQQMARFLDELFPDLGTFASGSLHASSLDPFSLMSLRQKASGSLSVLPGSDRILPLPLPPALNPFGEAEVSADFFLDGEGSNIDSLAFWTSPDSLQTLLFVTAKSNELVEVWRFPFQGNEQEPIRQPFGSGRVNGILVDQEENLLYVAQAEPDSTVFVFSLPELEPLRQFGAHPLVDGFGSEPGLSLMTERFSGQKQLYVTVDRIVHVYQAQSGEFITQFRPQGPRSFETIQADGFHQLLYIPDENDQLGVFSFRADGAPTENCNAATGCRSRFGEEAFQDDGEGILLYTCPSGAASDDGSGWVVVSDQRNSRTDFEFFDRITWEHLGTLRIEGVGNTDGIASLQRSLPGYPLGLFAAVDDDKRTAVLGWDKILDATGLSCPPQP